jgi:hypothetical protein
MAQFMEDIMPKPKLSPEGEVIAAYGTAMVAAFQVPTGDISDMTLAVLHDIRMATLD